MTHNEIVDRLFAIRPGAKWTLRQRLVAGQLVSDFSDLEWLDDEQEKPTAEEIGL